MCILMHIYWTYHPVIFYLQSFYIRGLCTTRNPCVAITKPVCSHQHSPFVVHEAPSNKASPA